MKTNNNRPVFLSLARIHQPVTAVASVLHRISGVVMVLLIPVLVYLFDLSLRDAHGFQAVTDMLQGMTARLIGVFLLWALAHHVFAGVRFLLLDLEWGMSRAAARRSAWGVHLGAALVALLAIGAVL